jgi:hypothetical protein
VYERLERYRIERGLTGWDEALTALLDDSRSEQAWPAQGGLQ